jgi:PKD repeat protein
MIEAPKSARVGETIAFTAKTDADGVPGVDYRWEFGDGVSAEGTRQRHTYTLAGNYKIKLLVSGVDGVKTEKELSLVVQGSMGFRPPARYVETLSTGRNTRTTQP